jgi:hypothetical protein
VLCTVAGSRSVYPKIGEVMYDHLGYGEKYDFIRERLTEVAHDDYDNDVYPADED